MRRAELLPFFDALSARGHSEFGALRSTSAKPRQQLLRRGTSAGGAYLVLKGALRVYYVTDEGREATLYHVQPGSACVLALSSTLLEQPFPAWAEAGPDGATFARVAGPMLHRFMDQEPAFREFVLHVMSSRIFELMCTLEEVATSTLVTRAAAYLVRSADENGNVLVTQAALAAELGTAREVVFRALSTLTKRGLIATRRGRVKLLDPRELARTARATSRSRTMPKPNSLR